VRVILGLWTTIRHDEDLQTITDKFLLLQDRRREQTLPGRIPQALDLPR
jgi:hypothetical protein